MNIHSALFVPRVALVQKFDKHTLEKDVIILVDLDKPLNGVRQISSLLCSW